MWVLERLHGVGIGLGVYRVYRVSKATGVCGVYGVRRVYGVYRAYIGLRTRSLGFGLYLCFRANLALGRSLRHAWIIGGCM